MPTLDLGVDAANMERAVLPLTNTYRINSNQTELCGGATPARQQPIDNLIFSRDALYIEFEPLVSRLLRQYGVSAELRRDLAGEIYGWFCSFIEKYDSGRGVPLRPYLIRHLTASAVTYARHKWSLGGGAEGSDLSEREVLAALPHGLAQLSDRERSVVLWHYYDALPLEEIAGLLNLEPSACRSLLRQALNSLRREMHSAECGP